MNVAKNYLGAAVSLAIVLAVLVLLIKVGKKAPVVGGAFDKVQELTGLEA